MYHQEIPCCCAGMSLCRTPNKTLVQILKTRRHSFSRVFGSLFPMLWFASWGHYGWMKTDHPIVPWPSFFYPWVGARQLLMVPLVPFPPKEHDAKAMRGGKIYINKQLGLGDRFGTHWQREHLCSRRFKSSCILVPILCILFRWWSLWVWFLMADPQSIAWTSSTRGKTSKELPKPLLRDKRPTSKAGYGSMKLHP